MRIQNMYISFQKNADKECVFFHALVSQIAEDGAETLEVMRSDEISFLLIIVDLLIIVCAELAQSITTARVLPVPELFG